MSRAKPKAAAGRKDRYDFFLNPYVDRAFTTCPQCEAKTKLRMFCLFIHVDPEFLISLNKSCRFCPRCELIIVKKVDVEHYLATVFEERAPEMIGNNYLVMGTVSRELHQQGKAGKLMPKQAFDNLTWFRRHLEFTAGGWERSPA